MKVGGLAARSAVSERPVLWLIGVTVLALLVWWSPLGYPFRLYATAIHELGHAVAALVTGGSVASLTIFADGSGVTQLRGGWILVVASGGYVGSALFGAALLVLASRSRLRRPLLAAIGIALVVGALLWVRQLFGFASLVAIALPILALARFAPPWGVTMTLYLLAVLNSFYAFSDLVSLVAPAAWGHGAVDAQLLARATFIPALVWSVVWLSISAAVFVLALRSQLR